MFKIHVNCSCFFKVTLSIKLLFFWSVCILIIYSDNGRVYGTKGEVTYCTVPRGKAGNTEVNNVTHIILTTAGPTNK